MQPLVTRLLLILFCGSLILFNIVYYTKLRKFESVLSKPAQHKAGFVKKIWQTAPEKSSDDVKKYMEAWKGVPGWSYNTFNDDGVKSYLHTRYPSINFKKLYEENKILAFDLFRYTLIYENGGLYLDSDVEKAHQFEQSMENLKDCGVIIGVEGDLRHEKDWVSKLDRDLQYSQAVFYASPKHPMMRHIVDMAFRNIDYYNVRKKDFKELKAVDGTGVGLFTDSILDYLSVTSGVNVAHDLECGQSYKINDVCILNARGFAKNTDHTCGKETDDNSHVLAIHHHIGSWKEEKKEEKKD